MRTAGGVWAIGARRWRVALVVGAVAFAALPLLLFGALRGSRPTIPSVAVLTEAHGAGADALAREIGADAALLTRIRAGGQAVLIPLRADTADYALRIRSERRGNALHAEIALAATAGGGPLWSAAFDRPAAEQAELRQQAAAHLADVLPCTVQGAAAGLDAATLRLFLDFCGRLGDPADADQLGAQLERIRQVTARAPGFARGWANRALVEARLATDDPELGAAALRHVRQARAADPALGETWLAEALLAPEPERWAERMDILDEGIAEAATAALYYARAIELTRVGRVRDAVDSAQRAAVLDPLSPRYRALQVATLANADDLAGARAALESAERVWPGSREVRAMRFGFDLRYGDARHALALLDDPATAAILGPDREPLRAFLRARIEPSPANIDAAVWAATRLSGAGDDPRDAYLRTLAYFGRVDQAFAVAVARGRNALLADGADILFRSDMRRFRDDPRFLTLAGRMGLVGYWRASGRWPDFCMDASLSYDCATELRRLSK